MSESTLVDLKEIPVPHFMTIKPDEGEDAVNLYTADWGLIQYARPDGKITSQILAITERGGLKIKRNGGITIYSSYITIKEAPDQPELVGKTTWVYRKEHKDQNGETKRSWLNVDLG